MEASPLSCVQEMFVLAVGSLAVGLLLSSWALQRLFLATAPPLLFWGVGLVVGLALPRLFLANANPPLSRGACVSMWLGSRYMSGRCNMYTRSYVTCNVLCSFVTLACSSPVCFLALVALEYPK